MQIYYIPFKAKPFCKKLVHLERISSLILESTDFNYIQFYVIHPSVYILKEKSITRLSITAVCAIHTREIPKQQLHF